MMARTKLYRDRLLGPILCPLAVSVGWKGAAQGAKCSSQNYGRSGGQFYNLDCGSQAVMTGPKAERETGSTV